MRASVTKWWASITAKSFRAVCKVERREMPPMYVCTRAGAGCGRASLGRHCCTPARTEASFPGQGSGQHPPPRLLKAPRRAVGAAHPLSVSLPATSAIVTDACPCGHRPPVCALAGVVEWVGGARWVAEPVHTQAADTDGPIDASLVTKHRSRGASGLGALSSSVHSPPRQRSG